MRRLIFAAAVCVATAAIAGEKYLGTITVSDAGTSTNRTTGYRAYTTTESFVIAPPAKISIQCDNDAMIGTDVSGCDAGKCVRIGANQLFPTSVDTARNLTGCGWNSDGGTGCVAVTYSGGWLAVGTPADAGPLAICRVFSRSGQE